MQKTLWLSLFCCLIVVKKINAQSATTSPEGTNSLASFDIHVPAGVFAKSHFAGVGLNYTWSDHRFGKNTSPGKFIGFITNAGGDYYFGKKITTAGYDFRYGGYLNFYVMPGIMANPWTNGNINLTAGPVMEIYKGNSDVGVGVNLFGSYYLADNISIGPGITYKKHTETNALWALTIRGSYSF